VSAAAPSGSSTISAASSFSFFPLVGGAALGFSAAGSVVVLTVESFASSPSKWEESSCCSSPFNSSRIP
jgi:hypothetical protein